MKVVLDKNLSKLNGNVRSAYAYEFLGNAWGWGHGLKLFSKIIAKILQYFYKNCKAFNIFLIFV